MQRAKSSCELAIWADNGKVDFPDWAQYFYELGQACAHLQRDFARLVVAVAVPTRAYAAVIAATGAIITFSRQTRDINELLERFQRLCQLPTGTAVLYFRPDGRRLKAVLDGSANEDGENCLRVRVESKTSGGLTYLVRPGSVDRVHLVGGPRTELPKTQTGRALSTTTMLRILLGNEAAAAHSTSSSLDCMLLGYGRRLHQEAESLECIASSQPAPTSGEALSRLLRVRQWVGQSQPYRAELISPTSRPRGQWPGEQPRLCVYDGAAGFLKHRDTFGRSDWLAVLDRTDSRFEDAVAAVNQHSIRRCPGELPVLSASPSISAVEVAAFWEPIQ